MQGWHHRFRAARRDAGFTSAEKLALELRRRGHPKASRFTTQRWEWEYPKGGYPDARYRETLAAIHPEFARLVAELPDNDSKAVFTERLEALERRQAELAEALVGLAERMKLLAGGQAEQEKSADE